VSPPLTTIIQPLAQMAAMATRTVLALLDGRTDTSSNRVELTTSLVVRASTAPPQKKPAGRGSPAGRAGAGPTAAGPAGPTAAGPAGATAAGPAGTRPSRRGRGVRSA
jgi:hypothetical protein